MFDKFAHKVLEIQIENKVKLKFFRKIRLELIQKTRIN